MVRGAAFLVFIFMGGVMDDSQTLIRVTPDWDVAEYPENVVPRREACYLQRGDYIALKIMGLRLV